MAMLKKKAKINNARYVGMVLLISNIHEHRTYRLAGFERVSVGTLRAYSAMT
jgi:hypothetical protein